MCYDGPADERSRRKDPHSALDRTELAKQLSHKLGTIGFKPSERRVKDHGRYYNRAYAGKELVLTFRHRKDPGLVINVFTSIVEGAQEVRSKGADAIRICTEYETKALRDGKEDGAFSARDLVFKRPLQKDELAMCTVHRRGASIEDIVDRVVARARSAYKALNIVKRCPRCSAPIARSKAGKEYCTERCWLNRGSR
jgi:hypothetical protein